MKRCSRCRETLPLDRFNRDRNAKDGRAYTCRECKQTPRAVPWGTHVPFPRDLFAGTNGQVAARLGVTRRTVHRWTAEGVSTVWMDDIADELGCHPTEIWDCYYEVAS